MHSEEPKQVPTGPWYYLENGRVLGPLNSAEVKLKFEESNLPPNLTLFSDPSLKRDPTKVLEIVHSLEPSIQLSIPTPPSGSHPKEEPSLTPTNVDSENEAVTQLIQVFQTSKQGRTGYTTNQSEPSSIERVRFSLKKWIAMTSIAGLLGLTLYAVFNVFRILKGDPAPKAFQEDSEPKLPGYRDQEPQLPAARPFRTTPPPRPTQPRLPRTLPSPPTPPPPVSIPIDRDSMPQTQDSDDSDLIDLPPPYPTPDDDLGGATIPLPTPDIEGTTGPSDDGTPLPDQSDSDSSNSDEDGGGPAPMPFQ